MKEAFERWTPKEIREIQRELNRLGLYSMPINTTVGESCQEGLVEAFGGDQWRSRGAWQVLLDLKAAKPPSAKKKGEHLLRYGEMFKDGVLDITLGVGFDESGAHIPIIDAIVAALIARGFKVDLAAATKLYAAAGRTLLNGTYGTYYVRRNAITYKPPAGATRQIDVVVCLVENRNGSHGADAARVFKEGMRHSDISYYSGHARYGSGPDFDTNMTFEVKQPDGSWRTVLDYEQLKVQLETRSKSARSPWKQFLYEVNHKSVKVHGFNQGNVYLNPSNKHPGEFGGNIMYWNLKQKGGAGATPMTGRRGELAKRDAERKYHLWVFDGCRTRDYVASIRGTPNQGDRKTDIIATERVTYWNDKAEVVGVLLDSLCGLQSAEQIIQGMEAKNVTGAEKGRAVGGYGFKDNPVIR